MFFQVLCPGVHLSIGKEHLYRIDGFGGTHCDLSYCLYFFKEIWAYVFLGFCFVFLFVHLFVIDMDICDREQYTQVRFCLKVGYDLDEMELDDHQELGCNAGLLILVWRWCQQGYSDLDEVLNTGYEVDTVLGCTKERIEWTHPDRLWSKEYSIRSGRIFSFSTTGDCIV